jgi:glycosyltransferase 2 family protein
MEEALIDDEHNPNGPVNPNGLDKPPKLWGWHTLLSGMGTLILLAVLATFVDWQSIWRELLACQAGYILLGAMFHYLTYPLRGLRWRHCLSHLPISGSRTKFGLVVFFYNFIDNVVPAKLGDIYASHMARINFGIRRFEAMGSIVYLRMLDAWVILCVALCASFSLFSIHLPGSVLWAMIAGGVIALITSTIIMALFFLDRSLPGWIPEKIKGMIKAFRRGMWPRKSELLPILLYTALIWTFEALWIFFLGLGFGQAFSPSGLFFLTMIPLLASVFPFTPSGAGVVEVTLFNCLQVVGISASLAGSITVVNRLIDYWLHIFLGTVLWLFRRRLDLRSWRELKSAHHPGSGYAPTFSLGKKGPSVDSGFGSAFKAKMYEE